MIWFLFPQRSNERRVLAFAWSTTFSAERRRSSWKYLGWIHRPSRWLEKKQSRQFVHSIHWPIDEPYVCIHFTNKQINRRTTRKKTAQKIIFFYMIRDKKEEESDVRESFNMSQRKPDGIYKWIWHEQNERKKGDRKKILLREWYKRQISLGLRWNQLDGHRDLWNSFLVGHLPMESVSTVEFLALVLFFVLTGCSMPRGEEQRMMTKICSLMKLSHAIALRAMKTNNAKGN